MGRTGGRDKMFDTLISTPQSYPSYPSYPSYHSYPTPPAAPTASF